MANNGSVVALGTFDGVHLGHIALIDKAREIAAQERLSMLIYTFKNHPLEIFACTPKLLMTHSERLLALEARGGESCTVAADMFTREYAATEPEAFARMLVDRFCAKHIVVGYNHTFGKGGRGTPELLCELGAQQGFEVSIVKPVLYLGEAVSSTRIRAALEGGDIKNANAMLGAPYALCGNIRHDKGIGTKIGFPTANLVFEEYKQLPLSGVYATRATVNGKAYAGVTNVGTNPTVNGERTSVETHIIDFSRDIYGEAFRVEFLERLRSEKKFNSMAALAEQIAKDTAQARQIN